MKTFSLQNISVIHTGHPLRGTWALEAEAAGFVEVLVAIAAAAVVVEAAVEAERRAAWEDVAAKMALVAVVVVAEPLAAETRAAFVERVELVEVVDVWILLASVSVPAAFEQVLPVASFVAAAVDLGFAAAALAPAAGAGASRSVASSAGGSSAPSPDSSAQAAPRRR